MQSIYIPQSKLSQIKALLNAFNKELHSNGLPKISITIDKPIVRDWFVTERMWSEEDLKWIDKGVKKPVKLHKLDVSYDDILIDGLAPIAFINGAKAEFDDLLNEPTICPSVSFIEKPIAKEQLNGVFQDDRGVICDYCNSARKRDKAFILKNEAGKVGAVYGASCAHKVSGITSIRTIKWCGYYQQKLKEVEALIRNTSRIISIETAKPLDSSVSCELFISVLHNMILVDGEFKTAKAPLPTFKRVISSINAGEISKHPKMFARFKGWVSKLQGKNKFHKKARTTFLDTLDSGVCHKNAALLAALYNDFLGAIKFSNVSVLSLGYYSGLLMLEEVEHAHKENVLFLKDAYGRVFKSTAPYNFSVNKLMLVSGNIEKIEHKLGSVHYDLSNLQDVGF